MSQAGNAEDKHAQPQWTSATDTISADIRAAAARIITDSRTPGSNLATLLNAFLSSYIPWPYRAGSGVVFDSNGLESSQFESLIYTSSEPNERVPADNLACAFAVQERLGLTELRESYDKIVEVKKLFKRPRPDVSPSTPTADATMGIIFSVDSDVPIERIAEEVGRLNRSQPYSCWPDMVVVLTRGTVNLICQFPHGPMGDFLPPARNVARRDAMYVHVFARSHAAFAMNKMCALLFCYLYLFQPGIGSPPYQDILKDMPTTGMPIVAFQFNLKGDLVPVQTAQQFNELFLFPLSFRMEDRQGKLHAKVQYLPWQDGGVVRVQGQFPIEALLLFAGKEALSSSIRQQDEQTSSVIPMSPEQFKQMAERVARQSNLVIKPDHRPKLVIHKRSDEGTSSPFVARIYLGICTVRDQAIKDKALKQRFDESFDGVLKTLDSLRSSAKSIGTLYSAHTASVARAEAAQNRNGDIHVREPIDTELRTQVETVINAASRVVKERTKELLKILGINIGFFFQGDGAFTNGIARLKASDPALAEYLVQARLKWYRRLQTIRNKQLEHGTWSLEHIQYRPDEAGGICVTEPRIGGQPVTQFVAEIVDRVCSFVEDLCIRALQLRLSDGFSIAEIPLAERIPENIARFRIALIGGGTPSWTIAYHDTRFEET